MERQLAEIKSLALKYSKQQLGRMVQMGMLEPQKAMMAGMMIDRVQKQNAEPPQATVAQDVLGLPPMASAQQAQPQMPPQMPQQRAPAPQQPMMAADGGLLNIPAGDVGEYAGGGIVAFDDGGEVQGYAKGDLVPAGLFEALVQAESRGKHSAVSNKGARGAAQLMPGTMRDPGYGIKPVRDDSLEENLRVGRQYLGAMLKKYEGNVDHALAAYNWGPGNVDKHLRKYGELTPEKLPKETQAYIPKVKNFMAQQRKAEPARLADAPSYAPEEIAAATPAGRLPPADVPIGLPTLLRRPLEKVTRLLPSAEAADLPAGMLPQAEYARGGIASFAKGKSVKSDPVFYQDPFGAPDYAVEENWLAEPVTPGKRYNPSLRGLMFGYREATAEDNIAPYKTRTVDGVKEDQFPLESYKERLARRQEAVGYATPDGKIARPEGYPEGAPAPALEGGPVTPPFALGERRARRPDINLPGTKLDPSFYEGPDVPELSELGKANIDYLRSQGVDPDMYQNMIAAAEERKSKLSARKDESKGEALMNIGLGLLGSRRGQEFDDLRKYGQAALSQYKQDTKDLRAAEEKLEDRIDAFRVADQQAKQSRAEKDIARRNQLLDQVESARATKATQQNELQYREAQLGMQAAQIATQADVQLYTAELGDDRGREELMLRGKQLDVTSKYYDKVIAAQEARNKALGQAAQAKFMGVKQKILQDMKSDSSYTAFIKDLKSRYGDNWANIPKAQIELGNFQKTFLGQQLEGLGDLDLGMPGIRHESEF
jgi:soluble lytic murein transglycosylase-like protein